MVGCVENQLMLNRVISRETIYLDADRQVRPFA